MRSSVPVRRRRRQGQPHERLLRGDARRVRLTAQLAFSAEGHAVAARPVGEQAPHLRHVSARPELVILPKAKFRDEHRVGVSAIRLIGYAASVAWLRQRQHDFFTDCCGLFFPCELLAMGEVKQKPIRTQSNIRMLAHLIRTLCRCSLVSQYHWTVEVLLRSDASHIYCTIVTYVQLHPVPAERPTALPTLPNAFDQHTNQLFNTSLVPEAEISLSIQPSQVFTKQNSTTLRPGTPLRIHNDHNLLPAINRNHLGIDRPCVISDCLLCHLGQKLFCCSTFDFSRMPRTINHAQLQRTSTGMLNFSLSNTALFIPSKLFFFCQTFSLLSSIIARTRSRMKRKRKIIRTCCHL